MLSVICRARAQAVRYVLFAVAFAGASIGVVASGTVNAAAAVASTAVASTATACPALGHVAPGVSFGGPVWRECFTGSITQSSPTFATYDGTSVVAIGDEQGYVHLLDAATGAEMPGWPERVVGDAPAAIESSPTIAYLDGPKRPPSIIVGTGSTWATSKVGEVEAFNWGGGERFVFHVGTQPGTAVGVVSSPAVGPLLGNGQQDIVFGSWDHSIYALNASGHLLPGFPFNNGDTIWSSPALYRLPGTAGDTIFLGTDASGLLYHQGGPTLLQCASGGFVGAWRYTGRAVDPIWRNCLNQSVWSSPAVGMLFHHRAVVVVGTSFFEQPFPSDTDKLFAFYANNGAPVHGWPVPTTGPVLGSPAIGLIARGREAVVDTSWYCTGATPASCGATNRSRLTAYSPTGHTYWSQTIPGPESFASPVLAPLRGTTTNDVMVGTSYGLYPISGVSGGYLFGTNGGNQFATLNSGCRVYNSAAIGAIPAATTATATTATTTTAPGTPPAETWYVFEACGGPPAFHVPGEVAAYKLPVAPGVTPAWPMFRQNASHTGLLPTVLPRL